MARLTQDSLRSRVPGAIVILLALGVTAFGAVAYGAVLKVMVEIAEVRMSNVAQQIAQSSVNTAATRERRFRDVGEATAIRAALRQPTAANVEAARKLLAQLGPDTGQILSTYLRDSTGRVVASLGRAPVGAASRDSSGATDNSYGGHLTSPTDTGRATPMMVRGDSVLFEYGIPVMEGTRVIGRVSSRRRATSSATNAALAPLRNLIGADAQLLVGNLDGSVWIDLQQRVSRPPPSDRIIRYERDGRSRFSVSARTPATPLVIAIEFPEDRVLAPMTPLLWTFIGVGLLVIVIGGGIGWWISSEITGPILRLTTEAEAMAAGNLSSPSVETERKDEVGRLSRAFEAMRLNVRTAHDSLESQVTTRTNELRRAQEELVKKEKLATLGQLSSSLGHELRNPLGVMTNAIYFLEMTLTTAGQKTKDYLGILRTQIRLSEKIVSDLLDFARVKTPQRTNVQVQKLVDEQLERVTIPMNVRIERHIPLTTPAVHVDAVQIGQILLNLITNAVQSMEEAGGTLVFRAHTREGRVRLEVADSGPGVAPENLTRIFEPLFTTKARGIGLGLSVSRSLAEANDGTLTVASEQGRGATFTLDLPGGAA